MDKQKIITIRQYDLWKIENQLDELKAKVRRYYDATRSTNDCAEMMLSCGTSDEPSRRMNKMYKTQAEMFRQADIHYTCAEDEFDD